MKRKSIVLILVLILSILCITATGCFTKNVTEEVNVANNNFAFENVVGEVINSTVTITCVTDNGTSGGAGVVVSSEGHILTNYHVISGARSVTVRFADAEESEYSGLAYNADIVSEIKDGSAYTNMDLALIKIRGSLSTKFKPVKIKTEQVKWGEYGVIIGNPKQVGSLCAHAMVSNPSRLMEHKVKVVHKTEFITLDAPVNPGNSGGGFFDSNGKLAGIVTLRQYDDSEANKNVVFGIAFAMPANTVNKYLQRYGINL